MLSYFAVLVVDFVGYLLLNEDSQLTRCYHDFLTTAVEHVFKNILKKRKGEEEYTIFNFKTPPYIKFWLYVILVHETGIAFVQFWEDFLLEKSFSCSTDPNIACFSPEWSNYTSNCSNLDDNVTTNSIICYRFVFRLGNGLGSALGLISTFGIVIYLTVLLQLKVSNGSGGTKFRKRLTSVITIIAALLITAFTVILWYLQLSTSNQNQS